MELAEKLMEINRITCKLIWNLPDANSAHENYTGLIFPIKRDRKRRVSEQEARMIYVNILNENGLCYSVETPTEKVYIFSGRRGARSAQSDLTIYRYENGWRRAANIEFKAHNPTRKEIEKDIEKLTKEGLFGVWFHIFENVNSRTLRSVFQKIDVALEKHPAKADILFCFCVLNNWACMKLLSSDNIDGFFRLDYKVRRGEIIVFDSNGWEIITK